MKEIPIDRLRAIVMIAGPDTPAGRILAYGEEHFKRPAFYLDGEKLAVMERLRIKRGAQHENSLPVSKVPAPTRR